VPTTTTMLKPIVSIAAAIAVMSDSAAGAVTSLTEDNYRKLTEGKTVFLKMFAPWVSVCTRTAIRSKYNTS